MLNKILASTLTCCIVLLLTSSCVAESRSTETRPSAQKSPSYWEPSYWREYYIDWHHGFQEGLGEVEVNGKWGFVNSAGQIVIKPKFDSAFGFHQGIATVRSGAILNRRKAAFFDLAGRWNYIDKQGRPIFKKSSDYFMSRDFSEGLAPVLFQPCRPSKPWTLDWDISMSGITFSVPDGSYGFIDMSGDIVIPTKYADVGSFSEGLAKFEDPNGKYGYMNAMGEAVIEPRYDYALPFSMGLARVSIANKWGFINKRGDFTSLQYDSVGSYSEGLASVRKDGKWGYIDNGGRLVIPFKFDDAHSFSEGYGAVIMEGKIGYINKHGEYALEPQFEYFDSWANPVMSGVAPFLSSFSEGLAAIVVGIKWGYIDQKGDFVIEPKFDIAGQFTEGFAKVAVGDKLGYIDKQGKYIWEPTR